jgi:hypothetical protein
VVQSLAFRLVILDGDGEVPGESIPIDRDLLVLGRSSDSDVILRDPEVSRHHAELRNDHGRWVLRDLRSTHGTTRGGHRIDRPVILHHGDVIGLGPVHVRFEENASDAPTMMRPRAAAGGARPQIPVPRNGIEIDDQYAGSINNVEGVQNNYVHQVLQERQSFLREIAATRTRARYFIWTGVVFLAAGIATAVLVFMGIFRDFGDAFASADPSALSSDPFGAEVGGVPVFLIAVAVEVVGVFLVVIGIVLHVVATARRRDVDRRLPDPRIPRHR